MTVDLGRLMTPHRYHSSGCEWCLTVLGICVDGGPPERTAGEPTTMRRLWASFGEFVIYHGNAYGVPAELILATIATESGGNVAACRLEPGYVSDAETPHRVSPGLMQTLLSTAREVLKDQGLDRDFLLTPEGSIQAGTAYIAAQKASTRFDPPLVAAAYNAGGTYYQGSTGNRWKVRQYPIGTGKHVDRWIQWFGDALAVLREAGEPPGGSFAATL